MFKITKDGATVAMTEAPNYIKQAENGCFVLCPEAEATGIAHNGTVYHLLGRPDMAGAEITVMLEETDAGVEIAKAADATGIVFVTMAEAGSVDATTAAEHADLFSPWAVPVAYTVGQIRRYTDGKLYKCVQAHTSQADWTPDTAASLWTPVSDPAEEWPEWSQPVGAHDAYSKDAKVSHNGKHWTSNVLPLLLFLFSPELFLQFFIVWIMLGFALPAKINTKLILKVFRPFLEADTTSDASNRIKKRSRC